MRPVSRCWNNPPARSAALQASEADSQRQRTSPGPGSRMCGRGRTAQRTRHLFSLHSFRPQRIAVRCDVDAAQEANDSGHLHHEANIRPPRWATRRFGYPAAESDPQLGPSRPQVTVSPLVAGLTVAGRSSCALIRGCSGWSQWPWPMRHRQPPHRSWRRTWQPAANRGPECRYDGTRADVEEAVGDRCHLVGVPGA